jgi:tetratricopeptide (TPR) repeat protein
MEAFTTRDVARLLGLSEAQVRCQARAGFLKPDRGPRNSYRFSFQDLVLLRTARELAGATVPPKRIKVALCRLARGLPTGRSLSELRIVADGQRVLVVDDGRAWSPESEQLQIDFAGSAGSDSCITKLFQRHPSYAESVRAEEWFALGAELEDSAPDRAQAAYTQALSVNPDYAEAHVNLGRLLQLSGKTVKAIEHYRDSIRVGNPDPTAAFNLGTALEALDCWTEAIEAYQEALRLDRRFADAHFNLARLYKQAGNHAGAVRHLREYQKFS